MKGDWTSRSRHKTVILTGETPWCDRSPQKLRNPAPSVRRGQLQLSSKEEEKSLAGHAGLIMHQLRHGSHEVQVEALKALDWLEPTGIGHHISLLAEIMLQSDAQLRQLVMTVLSRCNLADLGKHSDVNVRLSILELFMTKGQAFLLKHVRTLADMSQDSNRKVREKAWEILARLDPFDLAVHEESAVRQASLHFLEQRDDSDLAQRVPNLVHLVVDDDDSVAKKAAGVLMRGGVEKLARHQNPLVRKASLEHMQDQADQDLLPLSTHASILSRLLEDVDQDVSNLALKLLMQLNPLELSLHLDPHVRSAVGRLLEVEPRLCAELHGSKMAEALTQEDNNLRTAAQSILTELGPVFLIDHKHHVLRYEGLCLLERNLQMVDFVESIVNKLSDADTRVRHKALELVSKMEPNARLQLLAPSAIIAIVETLENADLDFLAGHAHILAQCQEIEPSGRICRLLNNLDPGCLLKSNERCVRFAGLACLENEPGKVWAHASGIARCLVHHDLTFRGKALNVFSNIEPSTLAQHPDIIVQQACVEVLDRLQPAEVVQYSAVLVELLSSSDPATCQAASQVFATPKLHPFRLAKHADASVRHAALCVLERWEAPKLAASVQGMLHLLDDSDERVRTKALTVFMKVGVDELAKHPDVAVRRGLLTACTAMEGKVLAIYAGSLAGLLDDMDQSVCNSALELLDTIDFELLANHTNPAVRVAALVLLETLKPSSYAADAGRIHKWFTDNDSAVRIKAMQTFASLSYNGGLTLTVASSDKRGKLHWHASVQ